MGTINNNITDRKKVIAVSATDSWFGFSIARRLLLECGKKTHVTIRCLAKDIDREPIRTLEHLGGEIHRLDYNKEESLDDALHEAHFLVFITEDDEKRIKEAKGLAQAAARNDVCNVIVNSVEGAGDGHGNTQQQFKEIEHIFKETVRNAVVIRSALLQQAMFLWSRAIEEKGEIIMTPREKDEFAPFNLEDLGTAIIELIIQEGKPREELNKKHHQKCYLLTGPNCLNGKQLAEVINQVERHGTIVYRSVSRHILEEYLRSLEEGTCGYSRDDNTLAQRDAAYLIQGGLANFRQSMADFFRGTQQAVESGRINFYEGINRLDCAARLLGEIIHRSGQQNQDNRFDQTGQNRRQFLRDARNQRGQRQISQNVQSQNRGAYGQNHDQLQGQRRNQRAFNDSQFRTIVDFVNHVEDVLDKLRGTNVENLELLDRASRVDILNHLKEGTETIEVLERELNVVPLLYNTTDHDSHHYRPFLPLSQYEIELIADYLDYVKDGRARKTDDYQRITDKKPIRIRTFFEDNADCFVPPGRKRNQIIVRGDHNSRL